MRVWAELYVSDERYTDYQWKPERRLCTVHEQGDEAFCQKVKAIGIMKFPVSL